MANSRPTYSRLPVKGYQDNPIADALTSFYDEKLVSVGTQVQNFHTLLDPATCPVGYLDFLAYLVGMVDPYYDTKWTPAIKRAMIASANTLFKTRGTKSCLVLALSIQGINYTFYQGENLKFSFVFTSVTKFGLDAQVVFVSIPTPAVYPRTSNNFVEAKRAVRNYTGIAATTQVTYDAFYLGYSHFGEPFLNAANFRFAIRCGLTSYYTDTNGLSWTPDIGYTTGATSAGSGVAIANTYDSSLYQTITYRNPDMTYTIPVPTGTYTVTLGFAELFLGSRTIKISINGTVVNSSLNITPQNTAVNFTATGVAPVAGAITIKVERPVFDASNPAFISNITITA